MTPAEFIAKWSRVELRERQAAQSHFNDVCALVGHENPVEADPTGEWFCFERGAEKRDGGDGWADVWKKNFFGWEYKGKHKDLTDAYRQLDEYRADLGNPPLLVTCDTDHFEIHTNFTNTKHVVHTLHLGDLGKPATLDILRAVFSDPERLRPGRISRAITEEAAHNLGEIAHMLRNRGLESHAVARFLDRIVFCLFAEDVGLLPNNVMSRLLDQARSHPELFSRMTAQLFEAMAHGGIFGTDRILYFNGNLFMDAETLDLQYKEVERLYQAARLDWSAIDASIFGTLFERGMDPDKRSQLGAHYTSRDDIETLVDPVVMQPLRREWTETRQLVSNLLATGKKNPADGEKAPSGAARSKARKESEILLERLLQRLGLVKVLDPACGSGNFLYVTLQKLKDLEKEIVDFAIAQGFPASHLFSQVGPWQLYGIEVSPYACELARMTVWIGYLQWLKNNGMPWGKEPILQSMSNIELKDAILDLTDPENPKEPEWPAYWRLRVSAEASTERF